MPKKSVYLSDKSMRNIDKEAKLQTRSFSNMLDHIVKSYFDNDRERQTIAETDGLGHSVQFNMSTEESQNRLETGAINSKD